MVNQQIVALVKAIEAGDLHAAPALLDRLAEDEDRRWLAFYKLLGKLADEAADLPNARRYRRETDHEFRSRMDLWRGRSLSRFMDGLGALFWVELSPEQDIYQAIARMATALDVAGTAARIRAEAAQDRVAEEMTFDVVPEPDGDGGDLHDGYANL